MAAAFSVIDGIFRGAQMVEAGLQIAQVVQDKNATTADKVMAGIQGLFIGLQVADIGIRHSSLSSGVKFGSALSVGVCDVSRNVASTYAYKVKKGENWTKKDTLLTCFQGASVLLFRVGDITNMARGLSDAPGHIERCSQICNIAKYGERGGMGGGSIISVYFSSILASKIYNKYYADRPNGEAAAPKRAPSLSEGELKAVKADIEKLFRYGANVENIHAIPEFIQEDSRFRHFCDITRKPIRHILVLDLSGLNGVDEELYEVMYERETIIKWMEERSEEYPPEWPRNLFPLPLKKDYLAVDHARQRDINHTLREVLADLQKISLSVINEVDLKERHAQR